MSDGLAFITEWYQRHCDGDWEHDFGVSVDTIDNPGWSVNVDLVGTELENMVVDWIKDGAEDDEVWLFWRSTGVKFEAACGAGDLDRALKAFRHFAEGGN